ncbi:MFS transporter [Saccharopolyspora subtropica]|uniref:MFS transporter n=1 Tax=Saccharopolyspora thermophila TaxID=89367 RepID=A0A917NBZ8_9PSEU|nr:MFS transporter [Saccharopolyspora subtropica]GGI87175.1 MFS transporter [Saccharopolyspora subtropica]
MTASIIDDARFGPFHRKMFLLTAGGQFLDGYLLSIVGVVVLGMSEDLGISASDEGLIGAAALVGLFAGGLVFGRVTDRIGRQLLFTLHFVVIAAASIASMFVNDPTLLGILRFVIGVALGADYAIGSALLSEWLPRAQRGRVMGMLITAWFVGAATAYVVGYAFVTLIDSGAWRWALGSAAVPAVVFIIARIGTPESPRWLISRGRVDEAREVLRRVYGEEATTPEAIESLQVDETAHGLGFAEVFRGGYLRRTAFVGLFWLLQIVPLFAIYTFGPTILNAFGMSSTNDSIIGSALISVLFVIGCLPALRLIDTLGRRLLIIWSFALMTIPLAILGLMPTAPVAVVIACFCAYAFFSGGPNILEFIYPTELFPTEVRATAVGIGTAVSRIGAAIGTYLLPIGLDLIGVGATMLIMAAITLLGFAICVALAPETRGRRLADASATSPVGATAESQAMGDRTGVSHDPSAVDR